MAVKLMIGADSETHPFDAGWAAPRQVCTTMAVMASEARHLAGFEALAGEGHVRRREKIVKGQDGEAHEFVTWLLDRKGTAAVWPRLLEEGHHFVFHSAAYDLLGTMGNYPQLAEGIVSAIEEGRVWDTLFREKLSNNAAGNIQWQVDPFTGKMTDRGVYRLSTLVMRHLGIDLRDEKTDPNAVRLRYAEVDGVPLSEWGDEWVDYAVMDAVYPLLVLVEQDLSTPLEHEGHSTRCSIWAQPSPPLPGMADGVRRLAGEYHTIGRGSVAFNAASNWGTRTRPDSVRETIAAWEMQASKAEEIGREAGFVRTSLKKDGTPTAKDGTKDTAALRKLVSACYDDAPVTLVYNDMKKGADPHPPPGSEWLLLQSTLKAAPNDKAKRQLVVDHCRAHGLDEDLYTDGGALSTRGELLKTSGDPVLVAYEDCMSAVKYLSVWGQALRRGIEVPITFGVDNPKATGRVSVFAGKYGAPYHQIPRKGNTREAHRPRPGHVYVFADYDQIELRALAQLQHTWGLGNELRQLFLDGIDPHVVMGVELLNADGQECPDGGQWTYELATAIRARAAYPEFRGLVNDYRQLAKGANFGLPGGLGARTFVRYCRGYGVTNIDTNRAQKVKAVWGNRFPCNLRYLERINNDLAGRERMTIQQQCSGRVRGGVYYTSGANTFFQGLTADGFSEAVWAVWREQVVDRGTGLFGSRLFLPLHDELGMETPIDRVDAAARRLEDRMICGMSKAMPDVPVETEALATEVWSKEARRIEVDGKIVPYTRAMYEEARNAA